MRYEEWIDLLKEIEKSNKEEILKKMLEAEYNENIHEMLEPKIADMIANKFQNAINKIVNHLDEIFYDVNNLDIYLVNYRKDVNYIERLINVKQLSSEKQQELKKMLREETKNVYDILVREANREDPTGLYALTIKNNQIKWSD